MGRHLPKHKAQKVSNQVITYINIDSYIIASTFVTAPQQKPHHHRTTTAPPPRHHSATTAPPQRPPSDIRHRGNDFDDFVSVDLKNCGGGASWGGRSGGIPHVIPPDRPPQEIPSIQRTYARAHVPRTRRLEASPHENAGLPPMHHDDRTWGERGECLPPMRSPMHHHDRMRVWRSGLPRRGKDAGPRIPNPP